LTGRLTSNPFGHRKNKTTSCQNITQGLNFLICQFKEGVSQIIVFMDFYINILITTIARTRQCSIIITPYGIPVQIIFFFILTLYTAVMISPKICQQQAKTIVCCIFFRKPVFNFFATHLIFSKDLDPFQVLF